MELSTVGGIVAGVGSFIWGWLKVSAIAWVNKHKIDMVALVKLAEEQFSDGDWTSAEKVAWKNEAIKRLLLNDLPWYIPKKLVLKIIEDFIAKAIAKAKENKEAALAITAEVKPNEPVK